MHNSGETLEEPGSCPQFENKGTGRFWSGPALPPRPRPAPHPSRLNSRSPFSQERDATAAPSRRSLSGQTAGRSVSRCSAGGTLLALTLFPPPHPLCVSAFAGEKPLNVNLKAVTDALPTATRPQEACMCTPRTSPISAKCDKSYTPELPAQAHEGNYTSFISGRLGFISHSAHDTGLRNRSARAANPVSSVKSDLLQR